MSAAASLPEPVARVEEFAHAEPVATPGDFDRSAASPS